MRLLDFRFVLSISAGLLCAGAAQAQASRTWVSGVGDDVNPCSRTAPCKTFSGAISKTFINGEIDVLDPGGFGTINITKSMTLDGTQGSGFGSILSSGVNAVIVNIAAGNANDPLRTVRLRNLALNGTGASGTIGTRTGINGIRIINALNVYVENVVISDFAQQGILDELTTGGKLFVNDTIVRNNGFNGILILPSSGSTAINAMIDNTRSMGNGGAGVFAGAGSRVSVRRSVASGNAIGFNAEGVGAQMYLEDCLSSGNTTGIQNGATAGSATRISNCAVFANTGVGVSNVAGVNNFMFTFANNKIAGNTPETSGTISPNVPGQQ
jgi:hypothetical protein